MIPYVFQKYPENFAFQLCIMQLCISNLPVKFAIFLKSSLLFNSFYCLFLFINKTWLNNLKTRIAVNAKISVFVICVEVIIYLLYNLHDCTFKK